MNPLHVVLVVLLAFGPMLGVAFADPLIVAASSIDPLAFVSVTERLTVIETRLDGLIYGGAVLLPLVIGLFTYLIKSAEGRVLRSVDAIGTRLTATDVEVRDLRVNIAENYVERVELGAMDRRIDGLLARGASPQ